MNNIEIDNCIGDIVKALEARIKHLMTDFSVRGKIVENFLTDNYDIKDEKIQENLSVMVGIFTELKPIERLIRFKYPQFIEIFDKLLQIEMEKKHGTFFSFLMCIPGQKRAYVKKAIPQISSSIQNKPSLK